MAIINQIRKYGVAIVLAAFMLFYFYQQGKEDAVFREKIRQIEQVRKSLEDSVQILKQKTAERDERLRKLILRDLEIIDTLNHTLKKLNIGSKEIERKIEQHKSKIDILWKNQP